MFARTLQWCSALTVWRRSCALMPKGSQMSKQPRYLQQQLLSALAGSVLKVQPFKFKLHVVHACQSSIIAPGPWTYTRLTLKGVVSDA